jgi:hypothetical protein
MTGEAIFELYRWKAEAAGKRPAPVAFRALWGFPDRRLHERAFRGRRRF